MGLTAAVEVDSRLRGNDERGAGTTSAGTTSGDR